VRIITKWLQGLVLKSGIGTATSLRIGTATSLRLHDTGGCRATLCLALRGHVVTVAVAVTLLMTGSVERSTLILLTYLCSLLSLTRVEPIAAVLSDLAMTGCSTEVVVGALHRIIASLRACAVTRNDELLQPLRG